MFLGLRNISAVTIFFFFFFWPNPNPNPDHCTVRYKYMYCGLFHLLFEVCLFCHFLFFSVCVSFVYYSCGLLYVSNALTNFPAMLRICPICRDPWMSAFLSVYAQPPENVTSRRTTIAVCHSLNPMQGAGDTSHNHTCHVRVSQSKKRKGIFDWGPSKFMPSGLCTES